MTARALPACSRIQLIPEYHRGHCPSIQIPSWADSGATWPFSECVTFLYNLHPRADPGTTKHENVARRRRVDAEARVSSRVSHDGIRNTSPTFPNHFRWSRIQMVWMIMTKGNQLHLKRYQQGQGVSWNPAKRSTRLRLAEIPAI